MVLQLVPAILSLIACAAVLAIAGHLWATFAELRLVLDHLKRRAEDPRFCLRPEKSDPDVDGDRSRPGA